MSATPRTVRRRRRPPRRGGFVLLDAIIGGVILGVGLSVVVGLTGRSMALEADGESRLTGAYLADELLAMVLVDGPDRYALLHDTSGRFRAPFEGFTYDLDIRFVAKGQPYRVTATIAWSDRPSDTVEVQTEIALRQGDPDQPREPNEPVDRDSRYFDEEQP